MDTTLDGGAKPHTFFRFQAYTLDDEKIGNPVLVLLNPRNYCSADIYVNSQSTKTKEDGSKTYPYKDLQTALDKVDPNHNVIGVKNNVETDTTYFVSNSCKIIGCRVNTTNNKEVCVNKSDTSTSLPVITNTGNNNVFKLIGGKNCTLGLTDVILSNSRVESYVGSGNWNNNNDDINQFQNVIVHGGTVNINIEILSSNPVYYPTDNIPLIITLTDGRGRPLDNEEIQIYYDGDIIDTIRTNENGIIYYTLNSQKLENGSYPFLVNFVSDYYFKSSKTINIDCSKVPQYVTSTGGLVNITSSNHTPLQTYSIYVDGEYVTSVDADNNGEVIYSHLSTFGVHTIIIYDDNTNLVVDMIIVETEIYIDILDGVSFIKNVNITDGVLAYDTLTITNETVLGDLTGVVLDAKISSDKLVVTTYSAPSRRSDSDVLLYSDAIKFKEALISINYESTTTEITFNRVGVFWLGDDTIPAYLNISTSNRVDTGERTITATALSFSGVGVENIPISLYETYELDRVVLKEPVSLLEYGDNTTLNALLFDTDNSRVTGETVYFEAEIPNSENYKTPTISFTKTLLSDGENTTIKVKVLDENKKAVEGVFFKVYIEE